MGPLKRRIGGAVLAARRDDGVAQQVGDSHRPNAARHRGDEAGDRLGLVERHVADQHHSQRRHQPVVPFQRRYTGGDFSLSRAVNALPSMIRASVTYLSPPRLSIQSLSFFISISVSPSTNNVFCRWLAPDFPEIDVFDSRHDFATIPISALLALPPSGGAVTVAFSAGMPWASGARAR